MHEISPDGVEKCLYVKASVERISSLSLEWNIDRVIEDESVKTINLRVWKEAKVRETEFHAGEIKQ